MSDQDQPAAPPAPEPAPRKPFPIRLDVVVIAITIVAALLGFWDDSRAGLLGDDTAAPELELVHHQGGRVRLSDYKGKVVLIDFWATWCPPCVEEMPWLTALAQEYEENGVVFLAVSHDEPAERVQAVNRFLEKVPALAPYVVYGDPVASKAYGVVALPTLYVIGRDGKIAGAARGAVSQSKVRAWLAKASQQR